ncbi:hypothetical protein Fot_32951 [Forsythia ovata]|uniref:Uncharacterized protein n=1 Tax=Forsythia ovata TaxID=205694 RepID=A0ABD1T9E1_9LAMI
MTVRQRSHISKNHFARAFILMQDQNRLCEELSETSKRYGAKVEEYKKKIDDLFSSIERLTAEIVRQTKELEELRKNPKAENVRGDGYRLVNDLAASRARAQEREDKLQKEVEKKKDEINSFYIQHVSWKEGLAKKDEELGVLNTKVESQYLALAEIDSDEGKQIFEDGKQAGRTELLELIKDKHTDFNFDFLYEEGETTLLALLLEIEDSEAVAGLATSEAVAEPTSGALPSQIANSIVFENLQDL